MRVFAVVWKLSWTLLAVAGFAASALAQDKSGAARRTFEVASIKESPTDGASFAGGLPNNQSRFSQRRATLKMLVSMAYDVPDYQVLSAQSWVNTTPFDVDAKSEGSTTREDKMEMLRNLLADRFRLQFHRETKNLAAYALTVNKGGPKLGNAFHPSKDGDPRPIPGQGHLAIRTTLRQFANIVTQYLAMPFPGAAKTTALNDPLPVVDQTGLVGDYDISVDLRSNGDWFDVLENQLGLKLQARKIPTDVLIIDGASKPAAN